jgi:uncharacterized repeat protein (TIGR01451 family)
MKRTKYLGVVMALGALLMSGVGLTATAAQAATSFFQGFETDTAGWIDNGGTVARVASGDNGVAAATGSFYARLGLDPAPTTCASGGGDQPVYSGPFTRFGGYESTFPTGGYSTGVDVYLDVNYAITHPDTRFDWSSAINDPTGAFRRDFVFNVSSDPLGFVVDGGNNSTRCGANPNVSATAVHITSSGWYTFKHTFTGVSGGQLSVQMDLVDSSNAVVGTWTRSDPSDIIGSTVGGHRYGFFAQNEFAGLAIDNSRLAPLTPPPPSADLSVTKTDSPDPAHVGQKLTYTVAVTNNGPDQATGVILSDTLPKTTGFGSVSTTQGTCTRTKTGVMCNLGTLASGGTATVTIVVKPTQKGTITNTVTVAATSPTDPNTANNTASQSTVVKP